MYHFIIGKTSISTIYDSTNQTIEVEPNQILVLGDEGVNTAYLLLNERKVSIPGAGIYHLRFSLHGGNINAFTPPGSRLFYLVDVTDPNYNPANLTEDDPFWFKFYDDMLLAKVDASAFPTVTITHYNYQMQTSIDRAIEARTRYRDSDIEFLSDAWGIVLRDNLGNRYRVAVDNTGNLFTIPL